MVEAALRTVVRDVLADVAENGLSEPHHFYITFRTNAPGVEIPDYLLSRYPEEMIIVMQHQFWDLDVGEDRFSVTLSFNDRPERLLVPFEAVKVFADPGVEFGLQFTLSGADDEGGEAEGNQPQLLNSPNRLRPVTNTEEQQDESADESAGAEIVSLDRFRKK